jgi:two-component system, sensor histidine kinase and response regulator
VYKEIINNSRVLIVDDQPANVLLMERILEQAGYTQFASLTDSRQVMDHFRMFPPDLVILDLMMPNVDGFALMAQLRGWIPDETYLPILVITADVSQKAKQKALSLGAKDFLTKPVDVTEAGLRIYNLLETRWLHRQLRAQNSKLEDTVLTRTRDLTEAHRRLSILDEAKGEFLALISHELRTPLNGLLGSAELLLEKVGHEPDCVELRDMFAHSRSRILAIVDDALLLSQIGVEGQTFFAKPLQWSTALSQALNDTAALADSRQVFLQPAPAELGIVRAHEELLVKALGALVETAVKFARPGDTISLRPVTPGEASTLIIESPSGHLSPEAMAKFFDVFSLSEVNTRGTHIGLGPCVASRILALFGGSVNISNCSPSGIKLTVSCMSIEQPTAAFQQADAS